MAKRQIPKRASNPKRISNRAASFKRGQAKKEERRKAQKAAEVRNRELRAEGKPTPNETRKAAYKATRAARIKAEKQAGTYKPNKFNERGFIMEVVDGHDVLRDPGNWNKRRKQRYNDIFNGRVKTTETKTLISR